MKTKRHVWLCFLLAAIFDLIFIASCKKEKDATLPVLTTRDVSNITYNSASSGGDISSDGGSSILSKGVCWRSTSPPKITDDNTDNGNGASGFTSNLSGLTQNSTYYIRAYATNAKGTAYGNEIIFVTRKLLPEVRTIPVNNITLTSALSGGIVDADGRPPVTDRGICWSRFPDPATSIHKTSEGKGSGTFTSSISELWINMTYYVWAYATNSAGTSYGQAEIFDTPEGDGKTIMDIDGNTYNTVKIDTQTWLVENLKVTHYRNGDPIIKTTEKAVWENAWYNNEAEYCAYNNDENIARTAIGYLYNFYAVRDIRSLAPKGWHVATFYDFEKLVNYGVSITGGDWGWNCVYEDTSTSCGGFVGNNLTGFSALYGGYRDRYGNFIGLNQTCGEHRWWSTTVSGAGACSWDGNTILITTYSIPTIGYSVRCIKD